MTFPDNTPSKPPYPAPIGVFDSGYGGLTVLRDLLDRLPQYDYLYLGDNARAPYGSRSFDLVYQFTLQAVRELFALGCPLVILACNTASAKALRSIQQRDLASIDPTRRVLGVIRPTVEALPSITRNGHIGLLGTPGTVASRSYEMELAKFHPDFRLTSQACPMWVPLVENREADGRGADYFVRKYIDSLLRADTDIDTIVLGCTHYPLLIDKIRQYTPAHITLLTQGSIVAASLNDYLRRHPDMERRLGHGSSVTFLSTEQADRFSSMASFFLGHPVAASRITL